ncbi:MAG: nuclear transport factor 2 family protein [Alphaproteobacteria bacterium]|nr:MAG: nuclear transport factor 2 family protein [Alphaproteobacteria bacterium]
MLAFLTIAAAAAQATLAPTVELPPPAALTEQIARIDSEFFEVFFTGCDPERVRAMMADDIEMYHDKGGFVWRGADGAVADYTKTCNERKQPDAWRSRRELVKGTLKVDPVPGYGAIEDADHVFYERKGNGPEKLAGRAHLTQLWALGKDGKWRLARIFSFSHAAVE